MHTEICQLESWYQITFRKNCEPASRVPGSGAPNSRATIQMPGIPKLQAVNLQINPRFCSKRKATSRTSRVEAASRLRKILASTRKCAGAMFCLFELHSWVKFGAQDIHEVRAVDTTQEEILFLEIISSALAKKIGCFTSQSKCFFSQLLKPLRISLHSGAILMDCRGQSVHTPIVVISQMFSMLAGTRQAFLPCS